MVERGELQAGQPAAAFRRVSWGAIFGGTFVALGVWAMLYALGLAIGLTSINPNESIRGEALFTGIWSVLSPLVALFIGGWVAARLSGLLDGTASVMHGAVLWGLTTFIGLVGLGSLAGTVTTGAVTVGSNAVSGVANAVGGGGVQQTAQKLGIDTQDLLAPINRKLSKQGKPPVTANQLQAAVQSAVQTSLRQGRLDQNTFQQALAQNTRLSRADVQDVANTLQTRVDQALGQVQRTAAQAASSVGRVMWGVFFALLLGLISSVLGAAAGAAGMRRKVRPELVARRPAEAR